MASTRPPKETKLLPAAPVDWGMPLVVALGARLGEALPAGTDERTAPVELATVPLPGTIGVTRVGLGATGTAPLGVTIATEVGLTAETEGTTDGTTTGADETTGATLDGLTTGGWVAGGAWI